jgi:hypothetical protein
MVIVVTANANAWPHALRRAVKVRTELGMTLEDIDDRSRIDQEERLLRKIIKC